ncbi:unnamed protein product [Mycena citricolor]|uniref:Bromodomain associated domain-containing protein n=1 Tax=Mycena citricolor TaxID=2018698 RepID=A0AAD2HBE1_9AGAR|nr:unnamed protein product [Mycena citricolor]
MEYAANRLLDAATQRMIHAAAFSRASTQACSVLTDLLVRYISLLAATTGKYAEHAGRTNLTMADALSALEELGSESEDLIQYMSEAKELSRYAIYSLRRVEELHEFKARLGKHARDDSFMLEYELYEDANLSDDEVMDEEEEDAEPLSTTSRAVDWDGHVPSFLPAFPEVTPVAPESPRPDSPQPMPPTATVGLPGAAALPQLTATSTSAADYLIQIPYDESSLAEAAHWHLPAQSMEPSDAPSAIGANPSFDPPKLALYKAFVHALRHPQRDTGPSNPARHRVSMSLLQLTQVVPRWDLPPSMYASSAPGPPRAWPIVPTYAKPMNEAEVPRRFLPTTRNVAYPERIEPIVGSQGSRLPELARQVLPPTIYNRLTRINHPPPLTRGAKSLTYGPGVPAPWNAPDNKEENAKDRDSREPKVVDARVFATWEYEAKDFRNPIRKSRAQPPGPGPTSRRSNRAQ